MNAYCGWQWQEWAPDDETIVHWHSCVLPADHDIETEPCRCACGEIQ